MKYEIGLRTWIGLALFIAGAVPFYIGFNLIRKANASLKWPSADGKVNSSSIQTNHKGHDPTYSPYIGYTYFVGKRPYFNNLIAFGNYNSGRTRDVQKVVDRYPVNKAVKVYYNPSNPFESVLEPGEMRNTWDSMALALITLSAGRLVYRNPRRKVPKSRKKKAPLPDGAGSVSGTETPKVEDGFKVKVMFRFNLAFTCAWIAGGIIIGRFFKPQDFTAGFITSCALVLAGVCFEALWYRSWRVLRHNIEGLLTVIVWQLFLRQSGVDGFSMDLILFIIASTIIGYRKAKILPGVTTISAGVVSPGGEEKGQAASGPVQEIADVPEEPKVEPLPLPQGRYKNLRFIYGISIFYLLTSATLFFFMMGLRQWAEDEGHTLLQPMYAWFAALAFFIMILSIFFWQMNWRCQYCGKNLPDRERHNKTRVIRCPNCSRMNKY